jgi:hypothetical protein
MTQGAVSSGTGAHVADVSVRTAQAQKVGGQLQIDSSASPTDPSTSDTTLSHKQWERLSGQRDVMIKAMVKVFTWLNGGVFAFTFATWLIGIWLPDYRIVTDNTLMALIGATVVQAGIAFLAITRFLFPSQGKGSDEGQ